MPTVLVTGGAGYIGSHACKALVRAGLRPVSYDNLAEGNRWAVRWGPLEMGDIVDPVRLREVCQAHRPIAIMHFAASALVGESIENPLLYFHNNVAGSIKVINAARESGVELFILSSTCATYGIPDKLPIPVDSRQVPINPYGQSKLMVEQILAACGAAYGIKFAILRYFNAVGADPEGEIGETRRVETHLVPLALDAVLGIRPPLTVYGSDYPTPDGTAVRDYIHVCDLAEAHVAALRCLLGGKAALVANLGTGRGTSVKQVLAAVEKVTGCRVPRRLAARRPGDPAELVADPSSSRTLLNFEPRHSETIEAMIATAWRWHLRSARRATQGPRGSRGPGRAASCQAGEAACSSGR